MIWTDEMTRLAEPLEWFDALHARTIRRLAGRVVDLSFANPRVHSESRGHEVLRKVTAELGPDQLQNRPFGGGAVQRRRVAAGLAESSGVPFRVGDVFLTPGGSAALHVAFDVAFPLGGEVLVPVPCWIDYPLYLLRHGLSYRAVPLGRGKRLDVAALDREWGPSTAGVVLSQPACPTGVVYQPGELRELAALLTARRRKAGRPAVLVSDEVHRDELWAGGELPSPAALYPHTISTYSFGKAWLMQGQRAGYVALSPGLDDHDARAGYARRSLRATGHYGPTSVMQHVAAELAGLTADIGALADDQRYVRSALAAMGYDVLDGQATPFLYARCARGAGDMAFVSELAKAGLLAMPSTVFHEPGWFRLALNAPRDQLDRALDVLEAAA